MDTWIDINDQLPEDGMPVMACAREFGCPPRFVIARCSHLINQPQWYLFAEHYHLGDYPPMLIADRVTHWMPLPEPPRAALEGREDI